jgi:predicted transcriptional regulator
MSRPGAKQHVFASLAEIAQTLGHAHRLEILEHLGQGERSVEHLAERTWLTLANTSGHLQLLRRAGLSRGGAMASASSIDPLKSVRSSGSCARAAVSVNRPAPRSRES